VSFYAGRHFPEPSLTKPDSRGYTAATNSMDPLSVVAAIVSLVSFSNAVISTQYDIVRAKRSSIQSSGRLDSLLASSRRLKQAIQVHTDITKHLTDRLEACARTMSLRSDVASSCWQLARSKESQGWMTREGDSRGWEDTRPLEETCTNLMHCVQSESSRTEPAFWKLQSWIMVSVAFGKC
jgi:hypothetical protein